MSLGKIFPWICVSRNYGRQGGNDGFTCRVEMVKQAKFGWVVQSLCLKLSWPFLLPFTQMDAGNSPDTSCRAVYCALVGQHCHINTLVVSECAWSDSWTYLGLLTQPLNQLNACAIIS